MLTQQKTERAESKRLTHDIYLKAVIPYAAILGAVAFLFAVLVAVVVETKWAWALNLLAAFLFLGMFPIFFVLKAYLETLEYVRALIAEQKLDAQHRRDMDIAQVNIIIQGRVKNVNVNSQVDERKVLIQTDAQHWKAMPLDAAYTVPPEFPPALPEPKLVTLAPRNLKWMIETMCANGELTRGYWLQQKFPDGEDVTRGIYEAVMMALAETHFVVDRRQPKPGRLTTTDAGIILNALAARYPDGLVIRDSVAAKKDRG